MKEAIRKNIKVNLQIRTRRVATSAHEEIAAWWEAAFRWIEKIPFKAMSASATAIGGFIVIAYYVHIEYQPTLDAVNLPMLLGQVFYAGLLVSFIFCCLFLSVLFASNSSAGDESRPENSGWKARAANFLLLFLAHFPVILFAVCSTGSVEDGFWPRVVSWWPFIAWIGIFVALLSLRVRLVRSVKMMEYRAYAVTMPLEIQSDVELNGAQDALKDKLALFKAVLSKELSWMGIISGDLAAFLPVAFFSAFPWWVLVHILDSAPVSAHMNEFVFWTFWGLLAFINAVLALSPTIPLFGKFSIAVLVVFMILSMSRLTYLPFTLAVRLAGIGQTEHADLELSETRCLTIDRQLRAAGLKGRLICSDKKDEKGKGAQERQGGGISALTERVLSDVLLLNRVGTEFYVEIKLSSLRQSEQKKISRDQSKSDKKVVDVNRAEVVKERQGNKSNSESEPVIRFRVPKTDANELIYADRPIVSRALLGRAKSEEKK